MPLMRIRSVEIVFEDEMSACTDTALLDRSMELIVSDSDDSTKCVDDLEHIQVEREDNDDSVTINAEADLSEDNSVSLTVDNVIVEAPKQDVPHITLQDVDNLHAQSSSILSANEDNTVSLNLSDIGDSGRFTEDASSSKETAPTLVYGDAVLSESFDVIDKGTTTCSFELSDYSLSNGNKSLLYEYIDSNSDSSDNTAVCDDEYTPTKHATPFHNNIMVSVEESDVCDSTDLQYDSFIDMGKF